MLKAKPYLQEVSLLPDSEIDFNIYPYNIPAVRNLECIEFHPDVTFFVGENGTGKSTILEAIAVASGYEQEGGTKNVLRQTIESVSPLYQTLRLARSFQMPKDGYFLRAESFFNVVTYMDAVGCLNSYGNRSLHACSHGEAFMTLLTHKLKGKGLYFMDEPEAALSPNRQLATHSPILLSYPNAKIIQFDASGISEIQYEETEHFAVTRDFLNHYQRRLEQLFVDE